MSIIVPASSQARQVQLFTGSFGSASSSTADPYPLSEPHSIAADDVTHDVYVTDTGNHRVEKFSASGEFLLAFGADVGGPGVDVCGGLVPCTAGTPGSAPGQLTAPMWIAVDNSTGPSQGDVYVGDVADKAISKFDSSGNLITSWGKEGQLDGSSVTSPPAKLSGPFYELFGVAVDPSGNLWAYDGNHMYEFKQDASFVTDWGTEQTISSFGPFQTKGIAVDSDDNLYLVGGDLAFKFNSAGEEIGGINHYEQVGIDGAIGFASTALTVDPVSNAIYMTGQAFSDGKFNWEAALYEGCNPLLFRRFCEPTEFFARGHITGYETNGLAIDPVTHQLYGAEEDGEIVSFAAETVPDVSTVVASNLTPSSVTLNGTIDTDGVALGEGLEGCRFEWGETTTYGHVVACNKTAAQIGTGSTPVEVQANLSGLTAGKTYHFRLVAGNANDVNEHLNEPSMGQDLVFGPPSIDSESALNPSSTSVTLEAQVNPQDADTHIFFEYGPDTGYGQSTAAVDIGSGATDKSLSEVLQGLSPDTVYHYRVVANSALGTATGVDHTFVTQRSGGGLVLPDGREWELVSPSNKHGGVIYPLDQFLSQASLSGSAVSYSMSQANEADVEGSSVHVQVFSTRAADGGWSSKDIPLPRVAASDPGLEYKAFSEDLSSSLVEPEGPFTSLRPDVFPPDSKRTPYVRHDATCASEPGTCYAPIVTGAEGYEDVPQGTEFEGVQPGNPGEDETGKAGFVGASPDLSRVIVHSAVQLTETATPPGIEELYEWSASKPPRERLALVSKLENGQAASSKAGLGDEGAAVPSPNPGKNDVSRDGSRIVWNSAGVLYLTDMVTGQVVQLSAVQGGDGTGAVLPQFQFASNDLSHIFFTDSQRLTSDAGAADNESDLYECDIVEVAGKLHCELHDLTPLHDGESASLAGRLAIGSSEDGSWVYFVANGVLGETAGEGARPGECGIYYKIAGATCNLYAMHEGVSGWEAPRLVAVISGEDSPDWGDTASFLTQLTARVSPNGEWLAFMSQRPLTGYDNRDAVSGMPDEEVFLYHARAGAKGRLVCASCDPTGARPVGAESRGEEGLVGNDAWEGKEWLAASLPGWTPGPSLRISLYQSRYLSDSGRLFFDSSDALAPQDINGNQDVYEFEPPGVGSCASESSTYSAAAEGCVSLISSGRAAGESAFVDASENGNDVFFLTQERLSDQDVDNALDLYDAHVCTVALPCLSEPALPPTCTTTDSCRAAPSPQPAIFGAPASATFTGTGNLTPTAPASAVKPKSLTRAQKLTRALRLCAEKRNRHKRAVCEAAARRQYGSSGKVTRKNVKGRK
ncbi:MAG TPA: hypothetical protein VGP18_03715 [Solirubrobacteraceae bacterium]|nr:hypothetical protein [Solirubrobacteraceae bacterium]